MKYRYCIEKDGDYLIRDAMGEMIQRYDKKSQKWVDDFEMAQVYFGGIEVYPISEKEAQLEIEKYVKAGA